MANNLIDSFAVVKDLTGKELAPTSESHAWFLVRKGKAKLLKVRDPMVIQLYREVSDCVLGGV